MVGGTSHGDVRFRRAAQTALHRSNATCTTLCFPFAYFVFLSRGIFLGRVFFHLGSNSFLRSVLIMFCLFVSNYSFRDPSAFSLSLYHIFSFDYRCFNVHRDRRYRSSSPATLTYTLAANNLVSCGMAQQAI